MSAKHLIDKIEKYIRSGNNSKAREILLSIIKERKLKFNTKELELIANQCRRVQLSNVAIQFLSPHVKAFREGITKNLAPRALVEYAMALHRIGGSTEAKLLLLEPQPSKHYLSSLYLGLIHLSEWEYKKARVCFQNFLNTKGLDPYESCLGELNLIGTDIFLNVEVSTLEGRIKALIEATEKQNYLLLTNNSKEVLIQFYSTYNENGENILEFDNYSKPNARLKHLLDQQAHLQNALQSTIYSQYLEKWLCIDLTRRDRKAATVAFSALKQKAIHLSNWELIRECDFYLAKLTNSDLIFNKLYYGTPHSAYRSYLLGRLKTFIPKSSFIWPAEDPNDSLFESSKTQQILDLAQMTLSNEERPLYYIGGTNHRTLLAIIADFYRPLSMGFLFSKIYDGEFYDYKSSGLRIRQCLHRLKKDLRRHNLASSIIFDRGYIFRPQNNWSLQFSEQSNSGIQHEMTKEQLIAKRLKAYFGEDEFTSAEVAARLEKSHSSANRVLKKLILEKLVMPLNEKIFRKYKLK
jgi:hypothetical protein